MRNSSTQSGVTAAKSGARRPVIIAVLTCLLGLAAAAGLGAEPAAARPLWSGDYARAGLAYEGRYPSETPCNGHFQLVKGRTFDWYGRKGTLRMFYHPSCGVFARVDNVATYCYVRIVRIEPGELGRLSGKVTETTDGLSYAYTQVANNLNGRLAHAAAICSGQVVTEFAWF